MKARWVENAGECEKARTRECGEKNEDAEVKDTKEDLKPNDEGGKCVNGGDTGGDRSALGASEAREKGEDGGVVGVGPSNKFPDPMEPGVRALYLAVVDDDRSARSRSEERTGEESRPVFPRRGTGEGRAARRGLGPKTGGRHYLPWRQGASVRLEKDFV